MPEEYDQENTGSDELEQNGGEPTLDLEDTTQEVVEAETAESSEDTTETTTQPVRTSQAVSPYAQADDKSVLSSSVRQNLETWLPPEVVAQLESDLKNFATEQAKAETQKYVRAFEQQQQVAVQAGIPTEYIQDVKAYSHMVPDEVKGTPNGAQIAVLYSIYDKVAKGEIDFNEAMEKYANAANPKRTETAKPAPKTTPAQPLPAAAQPTHSQVSGRAVTAAPAQRTNGTKDNLVSHFPFAAKQ